MLSNNSIENILNNNISKSSSNVLPAELQTSLDDSYVLRGVQSDSTNFLPQAPTLQQLHSSLLSASLTPDMFLNAEKQEIQQRTVEDSTSKTKVNPFRNLDKSKMLKGQDLRNLIANRNITPAIVIYWRRGLQDGIIDPTDSLVQAVSLTSTRHHLLLCALSLRSISPQQGNNIYVNMNGSNTHIIAFMYKSIAATFKDKKNEQALADYLSSILLLMLVAAGFSVNAAVFFKSSAENDSMTPSISVADWLMQNRYVDVIGRLEDSSLVELKKSYPTDKINAIAIILNKPELYTGSFDTVSVEGFRYAIAALSPIIDKFKLPLHKMAGNNIMLWESLHNLYADGFEDVLRKSEERVSYQLFAMMLQDASKYRKSNNIVALQEVTKMIILTLIRAYEVDEQEYNVMSTLGSEFLAAVNEVYNKPFWIKYAAAYNTFGKQKQAVDIFDLPTDMRLLAATFNVTSSPLMLLEQIKLIVQEEPQVVIQAMQNRQRRLMSERLAYPTEVLGDDIPMLSLANNTDNIFDYGEYDLAYYRDSEGNIYAYPSTMFQGLISSKENPATSEKLPLAFLLDIKFKLIALGRDKQMIHIEPLTISKAIKSLRTNDDISLTRGAHASNELYKQFLAIALDKNITEKQLSIITIAKINKAFKVIEYSYVQIADLSIAYAVLILAHVLNEIKTDLNKVRMFFDALK